MQTPGTTHVPRMLRPCLLPGRPFPATARGELANETALHEDRRVALVATLRLGFSATTDDRHETGAAILLDGLVPKVRD